MNTGVNASQRMQARSSVWLIHLKEDAPGMEIGASLAVAIIHQHLDRIGDVGRPGSNPRCPCTTWAWGPQGSLTLTSGHMVCADSVTFSPQNPHRKLSQHSSQSCQTPDDDHKHHRPVTHRDGSGNKLFIQHCGAEMSSSFSEANTAFTWPFKKNAMKPQI